MEKIGFNFKDRRITYKLYVNEIAVVKGENDTYEENKIQRGGRETKVLFISYVI